MLHVSSYLYVFPYKLSSSLFILISEVLIWIIVLGKSTFILGFHSGGITESFFLLLACPQRKWRDASELFIIIFQVLFSYNLMATGLCCAALFSQEFVEISLAPSRIFRRLPFLFSGNGLYFILSLILHLDLFLLGWLC